MDQNRKVILAEVITNKSIDETPQVLGYIELTSSLKVESIFKHVQDLITEPEGALEDIEIFLEGNEKEVNLSPYKNKLLEDIGISCDFKTDYKIKVMMPKQKMSLVVQEVIDDDLQLGASASPTTTLYFNGDQLPPLTSDDEYGLSAPEQSPVDTLNYVGLVNQAMTCYLNSLLQALYMTPEFRNALYNWEFDGQNESRSIPFQLQKLFLNLQTSSKSAVETTDLTTSFGWQGSDAWQQHDIQELCRVMFDALEQKFKDTKQAKLINDLYEGKMLDYVRCLECLTEKSREDKFLDIPLPVRPFGSQVAYNSVEEALRAFVQPEILDGNNQYFCEKCNKKCNAHKGLKFTKFPYLLTLHLKRFDFDYNTFHRIKLNDKVVFPEMLNLNSFVLSKRTENDYIIEERENISKCDDCCTTDSGSALEDEGCQSTDASSTVNGQDVNCSESDEGIDVSSCNNLKNEPQGPYIYDLYSIMIHSGSATGGHYYAYVKDFDKQKWYCFNDQSVTRITEDDIQKTYGGSPHRGYFSGAYSSSTNAYMLMYRQIDKNRNASAMSVDEFPMHIKKLLKQMKEKEELDRINKEKENDFVKINIFCYHPVEKRLVDAKVAVLIDNTLQETVHYTAHQRFKLEGVVAKEDCRLVRYNKFQDCIDYSFESDQTKFCDIDSNFNLSMSDWLLEIRQPNTEWSIYRAGAVNMKIYPLNLFTEELEDPKILRVNVNETIGEIKYRISLLLGSSDPLQLALEKLGDLTYFDNDEQVINIDSKNIEYKLYVGNMIDEDLDKTFQFSKFRKIIEKMRQVIGLRIFLPDVGLGVLESLSIPTLDQNQNSNRLDIGAGDRAVPCCDGLGDQSNSEDSSLSDSDRTLVGDTPGDGMALSPINSNSPGDQHMASPTDPSEDSYNHDVLGNPSEEMHWDDHETEEEQQQNHLYFKMVYITNDDCSGFYPFTRLCKILVDKCITLEKLKKHLEPYVKVPVNYFKVYRQYTTLSIPPEDEWYKLTDTLRCRKDGDVLSIKLGRVLQENEHNAKIFLLRPNHKEPISFLFDFIITKGQTVGQVLKEIVYTAKKRNILDLNHQKCRLRGKSLKKVKKVYLENQVFGEDIFMIAYDIEIFLQELPEPENVVSLNQFVIFLRRWRPSLLHLDPVEEIVLNSSSIEEMKEKISQLSGIPSNHCEVALVNVCIPGDMHRLQINDLDWKTSAKNIDGHPLYASDGSIFYYRDNREPLKMLTTEERKEINLQENKRLGLQSSIKTYSPGKERALKIYVDTSPNKKNCID
ncbi:ubiquitin carboxyl-terminal hydrolase 47 isoform X2 [Coccinella septempunctata]|uniref:ubiquitin carboxyl-terminal hydrolase 47 isoform X2 n=1 Tax=Coccinella septempunctata TaxID=41139 RepID=UPI001D072D22|nr:ubiquitin carboxyl-terminal hydrolase 47 isoform X2 [Coccinella septempunctata]